MEARLAKIEAHYEHINKNLDEIKQQLQSRPCFNHQADIAEVKTHTKKCQSMKVLDKWHWHEKVIGFICQFGWLVLGGMQALTVGLVLFLLRT